MRGVDISPEKTPEWLREHVKRCSTSFSIREMQIRATMKCTSHPRLEENKNNDKPEGMWKWGPLGALLVRT